MFQVDEIREFQGHNVVDRDGKKIGKLEAVYVDTTTDQPAFGTIKVGFLGRARLAFVPLADATVGPGYLKVNWPKKQVTSAPSIATDGVLDAAEEPAVFSHYDMPYQTNAGARRLGRP